MPYLCRSDPFHTLKPLQDGMYRPEATGIMALSDDLGPSLLWVDWRERHSRRDEARLVTTNVGGMVNVIDMKTRLLVQKVPVTKAHGIVSVEIQAGH